jgi:rhamnosyltransferase
LNLEAESEREAQRPAEVAGDECCKDVCAIIVTYNPEPRNFQALLHILLGQVGRLVIVDNASGADVRTWLPAAQSAKVDCIRNPYNQGIAAAQNAGLARAMTWKDCRYVLLSDQDSVPAPEMVLRLRSALQKAEESLTVESRNVVKTEDPSHVAAVGPRSIDMRTGADSFFVVDQGGWPERMLPPPSALSNKARSTTIEVSFLIASGSLVPVDVLRALKGMRSNYFIDHVDTEWCLRARAAGFRLLAVPEAHLHHQLGDSVERIWFFGPRQVAYHTPLRDYYMFRNTLLMLRDVPMSLVWRVHFLMRLVKFAGYFLTLGDHRLQRLRHMWLGVRHGLRHVSGRLRPGTNACEALTVNELDPAI